MTMCVYSPRKNSANFMRAVLGVVAADQFLLGLRQVERQAIALGERAVMNSRKRQRLVADVPADQPRLGLLADDALQVERAGQQDDAEDRHAQRDLVADDLGAGAQRAEEAVFVVGRPAAQDDAVHRQAGDGEDEQDADVDAAGR